MPAYADRLPTAHELEQGYAVQVAEEQTRYAAWLAGQRARPQTDAAVELAALADAPPDPPRPPTLGCPTCGRVFQYTTMGMARMQLARHARRAHPETVEAA